MVKPPEDRLSEMISVRFTKSTLDQLRDQARRQGVSVGDLIRQAVADLLKRKHRDS